MLSCGSFSRLPLVLAVMGFVVTSLVLPAAPESLEARPVSSPDGRYGANVEWEDAGFIGIIRMRIFQSNGDPYLRIELPEINPSPANLMWINEEWVGCESFLGDRGSGFFFVHVPTRRGYLIDIVAPENSNDWLVNVATNDNISSESIRTYTVGRNALFPILLRDLPTDGAEYFTEEFAERLREAVDAFSRHRAKAGYKTIELVSPVDVQTSTGAVAVADIDEVPKLVYFPVGTTSTQAMLSRTRRIDLPEEAVQVLTGLDPPTPVASWTNARGGYQVLATSADASSTAPQELTSGTLEGVWDEPYVADTPAIEEVVIEDAAPEPAKKSSRPVKSSRKGATSKRNSKKPSRSN